TFNPLTDSLKGSNGIEFILSPPAGKELPPAGFEVLNTGYIEPPRNGESIKVEIGKDSKRLQKLEPFKPWDGNDFKDIRLLIKTRGKCTTDHISMAGQWLRFRGHLDNISDNLLMGAVNFFNDKTDSVKNTLTGEYDRVSATAREYKKAGIGTVVIAEENYGEGSSREHAAMEPRHLGVKAVIVKSFARIHETNLKKQGVLALTFASKDDYDLVREDDIIDITGLTGFEPGKQLMITLAHKDGSQSEIYANHSYNEMQIGWFRAGSALNIIREKMKS
ncbi:MAG: aconitate hydratase, partial [Bacteroidia bacterium]